MKEKHGGGKGRPDENTKKIVSLYKHFPPSVAAAASTSSSSHLPSPPLPTTTSLFFITYIFPSPILPVLSAVSKINWGMQCILVHVGMVARVRSLSICLGCQGVS